MKKRSVIAVSDSRGVRSLHVGGEAIQSSMKLGDPFALALDYTRCMMAFLLFHPEFPYSVRYSVERMHASISAFLGIADVPARVRIERIIGRLRASLAFTPMTELGAGKLHAFLNRVIEDCAALHLAVYDTYIDYPIEVAFDS